MEFELKTKDEYRKLAKNIRSNLDMAKVSSEICENLSNQDFYRYSENILAFYPMSSEVNLKSLFEDSTKNWFLPRIDNSTRGLIIHPYSTGDILVKSKWGVYEPSEDNEIVDAKKIDIAIIPALMVDSRGYRLGYGAGFYDRFISGLRKDCLKLVPLPNELIIGVLPADNWDIPVDKVITQNNLIKIK